MKINKYIYAPSLDSRVFLWLLGGGSPPPPHTHTPTLPPDSVGKAISAMYNPQTAN